MTTSTVGVQLSICLHFYNSLGKYSVVIFHSDKIYT